MNCPNCHSETVTPEGLLGESVCTKCGLVADSPATAKGYSQWNPEWRSNWTEKDPETLREWLTDLRIVSCQLGIPDFPYREEAARTIRKARPLLAKSQKFGKNKRATAAALLHLVLREYDKVRPIKSIAEQLGLDSTLVMKQAWALNDIIKTQNPIIQIQRKTATDYLVEHGGKMQIHRQALLVAQETLSGIRKKGGNPICLAAGALYFACKRTDSMTSKEQIAKVFGISPRTVDTNERTLRRHIEATSKAVAYESPKNLEIAVQPQKCPSLPALSTN